MVGNGTGNAGDGNEKPPHGFAMRGLGGCLGYSYLGFLRCQNTSDTTFRSSIVALCQAIERNLAIGSPFSSMMAITATRVVFHPAAFAAAWVALIALFTSAAVLLISNLLPPIWRNTQVKLVMASHSFLVVLVCGCAHHTSPIRRGCWIIHTGVNYFPDRSGNRSGAGRCVCGHLRGDRRFWGHFRACNWDAWICAWIWKTIRNQRYGNGKTPAGFALLGLVVLPLGIN